MKGTRIIINALTAKGRDALAVQKADELALREKYEGVSRKDIPRDMRSYLRTISLFIPKDDRPVRHEILGFKRLGAIHKQQFYLNVKKSFLENGCSAEDFEVKFYDN